jgi:hypothetical protein
MPGGAPRNNELLLSGVAARAAPLSARGSGVARPGRPRFVMRHQRSSVGTAKVRAAAAPGGRNRCWLSTSSRAESPMRQLHTREHADHFCFERATASPWSFGSRGRPAYLVIFGALIGARSGGTRPRSFTRSRSSERPRRRRSEITEDDEERRPRYGDGVLRSSPAPGASKARPWRARYVGAA